MPVHSLSPGCIRFTIYYVITSWINFSVPAKRAFLVLTPHSPPLIRLKFSIAMAQGKTKGLTRKAESSRHAQKAAAAPKKGKRVIPPKKAAAVKQAALHKVCCIASTQV